MILKILIFYYSYATDIQYYRVGNKKTKLRCVKWNDDEVEGKLGAEQKKKFSTKFISFSVA